MTRRVVLTPPTIDGETMPSWFYDRWNASYRWIPPRSIAEGITNGRGELYIAGLWTVEWTWEFMDQSWWRWWTVDILGGALQKECDVTIWSPNGPNDAELTEYTDVMIYHPGAFGGAIEMSRGMFQDVTVRIGRIALSTLPSTQYWTVDLSSVGGEHEISP